MQNHKKTKKKKNTTIYIYTNPTKSVALHGGKKCPVLIAKSTFIIRKY
jgi:hypothetical protein